jgi:SAM-dependent methyltransferase
MNDQSLAGRLRARWSRTIDEQHSLPSGLLGRAIGARMVRQHAPETDWTLDLLDIRPADRVLELGPGAGHALGLAQRRADQGAVLGLDRSETMLAAASRRNRAARRSGRLALVRADIHALPLAGAAFDRIFSIHTFYFWADPLRRCVELVRLLAPGGRLAITLATSVHTPGGTTVWPVHERVIEVVEALNRDGLGAATLESGPLARQFQNVAILVRR